MAMHGVCAAAQGQAHCVSPSLSHALLLAHGHTGPCLARHRPTGESTFDAAPTKAHSVSPSLSHALLLTHGHTGPRLTWYRPTSLARLLQLKAEHPNAKLVVGNTEVGIEMKFKAMQYPVVVSPVAVPELNQSKALQCPVGVVSSAAILNLNKVCEDVKLCVRMQRCVEVRSCAWAQPGKCQGEKGCQDVTLVVGKTEVGMEIKFKATQYPVVVSPIAVLELNQVCEDEDHPMCSCTIMCVKTLHKCCHV
eukprot:scaffold142983_cov22-Tisochrysis_lutea.AAC.3